MRELEKESRLGTEKRKAPIYHQQGTKGITLITLVITIVVILILAGISMLALAGDNGILAQANEAKIETELGKVQEALNLHLTSLKIQDYQKSDNASIDKIEGLANEVQFGDEGGIYVIKDLSKIKTTSSIGKGKIPVNNQIQQITELKDVFIIDQENQVFYIHGEIYGKGEIATIEKVVGSSSDWRVEGDRLVQYLGDRQAYQNIVIPNYVDNTRIKTIGSGLFAHDTYATSLQISDGIQRIEGGAFYNCSNLTGNLNLPKSLNAIYKQAFYGCGFTGDLVISDNVSIIQEEAFANCSHITGKVDLGKSLETIENRAFSGMRISELNIGMTNIPDYLVENIFGENSNDLLKETKLILKDHVQTIGTKAFCGYKFKGDLVIPNSVTTINAYAFASTGFTTLTIGDQVETIALGAFWNCSNFTGNLIIPEKVRQIGERAFGDCNGFDGYIELGNGLETIGKNAFEGMNISDLRVKMKNIPENFITYCFSSECNVRSNGKLTLLEGIETIGNSAFAGCEFTGDLIIPNSVITIGNNAFASCRGYTGLTLGNKVRTIANQAFVLCENFAGDLVIPDSVEVIGYDAFAVCGFTGNLTIGNGVKIIERAFPSCKFRGNLIIGNQVETIGYAAFRDCGFTGDLVIPDSVITIEEEAFNSCTGFRGDLTIGDGVKTIGKSAFTFAGFTGKLIIGNQVETIGDTAFAGCAFTEGVLIPNSVKTMGTSAFGGCNFSSFNIQNKEGAISGSPWSYSGTINWEQ